MYLLVFYCFHITVTDHSPLPITRHPLPVALALRGQAQSENLTKMQQEIRL